MCNQSPTANARVTKTGRYAPPGAPGAHSVLGTLVAFKQQRQSDGEPWARTSTDRTRAGSLLLLQGNTLLPFSCYKGKTLLPYSCYKGIPSSPSNLTRE